MNSRARRRLRIRGRAVRCCLWFGVLPSWVYEDHRHYGCSYAAHLWLNLRYAWVWITGRPTFGDIRFELRTNGRPRLN